MAEYSEFPSEGGAEAAGGPLDLAIMDQLLGLDDGEFGLLEEMLTLYKEDTPGRFLAMEHTLASGDLADMADVAHAIKGAASTMGARRVRAIAAELEAAGRNGQHATDPNLLLEQLKETYLESVAAMEAFIAANKP